MKPTMLILGAGFSGSAIAAEASACGWRVAGTTRTPARFGALRAAGAEPLVFDGETLNPDLAATLAATTHLVMSIAPDERGDPALRTMATVLRAGSPALRWIGYLSTVGVYGDRAGEWVDETAEVRPTAQRSIHRAAAETAWTTLAGERGVPLAILRLSGIYGPGRNALANLAEGGAKRIVKPGQVFNRIHVDDIAGAALFLATRAAAGIYNITDDMPAPPQDVVAHAARLMGVPVPPAIPYAEAGLSPMGRSFYAENKRVSNARLKALGYVFRHPDYRAAFATMLAEGNWKGVS